MSMELERIARNMKIQRAKKGWYQDDLSKETGLSVTIISRYENAEVNMGIDKLAKIAKAFGCTLEELVNG